MVPFNIKKILIPIDFSDTSLIALDHAVYLAKLTGAEITLVHVIENLLANSNPNYFVIPRSREYESQIKKESEKQLKKLADKIGKKEKLVINTISITGRTHTQIIETAEKIKADIIVMGTHGVSGFKEFTLGSNTFRVISKTNCPVLSVQKHSEKPGFKNILLPFRDKPHSREGVDYAIAIGKLYGAVLNVMGIDVDETKSGHKKLCLEAEQIQKIARKQELVCKIKVKSGKYLADLLLRYASRKKLDLIINVSDLDRVFISEYFMGPFSQQIVNHSPIPVLSIRPSFNPDTVDLHGYGW